MSHDVDAIYDQGVLRPLEPLLLPNGTRVHLRILEHDSAGDAQPIPARIRSPRLAHPEQAAQFTMEIREVTDAGL